MSVWGLPPGPPAFKASQGLLFSPLTVALKPSQAKPSPTQSSTGDDNVPREVRFKSEDNRGGFFFPLSIFRALSQGYLSSDRRAKSVSRHIWIPKKVTLFVSWYFHTPRTRHPWLGKSSGGGPPSQKGTEDGAAVPEHFLPARSHVRHVKDPSCHAFTSQGTTQVQGRVDCSTVHCNRRLDNLNVRCY